jgi:hypothetical protein
MESDLASARSGGKFVESRVEEAYDASSKESKPNIPADCHPCLRAKGINLGDTLVHKA